MFFFLLSFCGFLRYHDIKKCHILPHVCVIMVRQVELSKVRFK